ncbi:MAG TPA: DUF4267 domain-containing protein [Pseudonocardiaceae bacterium]|jgi:hypothetical protein|nr:DUF4267 domain-containing protein [Pseudonocardiaceae bacterium]
MLVHIADVIGGLVGVGIIAVGIRFILQPQAAAAGYGVSAPPNPGVHAYLAVKGGRDIAFGLVTLGLLFAASAHVFGLLLILESAAAIADAVIVFANKGKPAVALGVHGLTAAVMIVAGILLLIS